MFRTLKLYSCLFLILCLPSAWAARAYLLHGQGVYHQHHEHTLMVPASVQKVVTMFLAWHILGPNYHFHTKLLHVKDDHYQIVFSFDPTFTRKDLEGLISHLPKKKSIRLDLVSNGLTQPRNPHWLKEDLPYCYAAPLGPAIVNENCAVHKRLVPITSKKGKNKSYKKVTVVAPEMPYHTLPQHIKALAKKHGVRVSSLHWVMHAQPGTLYRTHSSAPLSQVMMPGLKHSTNIVMDAIWLATAQKLSPQKRINWAMGSQLMHAYFKKHGFSLAERMHIDDGSGLSPLNRVSLAALNQLLVRIEGEESLFHWALKAFPMATIDGTMKNRFSRYSAQLRDARIITKTGTFKRVRNYCGWITNTGGRRYRFIWFEHAPPPERLRSRAEQEEAMFRLIAPYIKHTVPKKRR